MLGSLEKQIVAVLEDEETATISEVSDALDERDVEIAYTTVSTVLDRLYDKDLVDRQKEPYRGGSRYVYEYVDIQDEYMNSVVDDVVTVFGENGVASLADSLGEFEEEDLSEIKDELGLE